MVEISYYVREKEFGFDIDGSKVDYKTSQWSNEEQERYARFREFFTRKIRFAELEQRPIFLYEAFKGLRVYGLAGKIEQGFNEISERKKCLLLFVL